MPSQLLFVCGFPSGGTDLLKTILNAHPAIYINGEMPLLHTIGELGLGADSLIDSVERFEEIKAFLAKTDIWNNIENLGFNFAKFFNEEGPIQFGSLLKKLFSERVCEIWGNKTPQNTENLGTLYTLFPQAKFLIIIRDIRDVCLSWQKKWGKDMLWCADKWNGRIQKGWYAAQTLPQQKTMFLKYESLITDTPKNCEAICEFLNITFSERMLFHHEYTVEKIDGKLNYGQMIMPHNFNKWKDNLTTQQIQRIEEIAFEGLSLFQYHVSQATESRPISLFEKGKGVANDAFGSLIVGNKASQQNSIVQRLQNTAVDIYKWRTKNSTK